MTQPLNALFPDWPDEALEVLSTIHVGRLPAAKVKILCDLLNINVGQLQRQLLPLAETYTIAPLSQFIVGVVAMGIKHDASGYPNLYLGANIEFTDVGMNYTIHAEQAVTAIVSAHGDKVGSLALNATPCGMCRQLLHEHKTLSHLPLSISDTEVIELSELLPRAFSPEDLNKSAYQPPQGLSLNTQSSDELLATAFRFSYAPYSERPVACMLEMASGKQYAGFSLESAAYNPGLSALSVALILAHFSGEPLSHRMSEVAFKRLTVMVKDQPATESVGYLEATLLWQQIAPEGELITVSAPD